MGRLVRRALEEDVLLAEWSDGDEGSYEEAAAVLERELEAGNTAARVDDDWKHESVTELPPDAELVIVTTAMGGG